MDPFIDVFLTITAPMLIIGAILSFIADRGARAAHKAITNLNSRTSNQIMPFAEITQDISNLFGIGTNAGRLYDHRDTQYFRTRAGWSL
ncbi:MAG: hypothetical protein ABOK23_12125 [Candidatus Methanoperedens sp.]|nr:hypothetical protein [Candidatus Methanoperedens sp.]MCZ7395293.1 hypothetical protein [Candidatus Methanoperedens sp.]